MSDWSFYERGLSLFPLLPNTKTPAQKWECYQTQRAAPDEVAHWRQYRFNTGVATGAVSGCIVLDADSLLARVAAEERGVPRTLTVSTPRGTHWYFQHPGWTVINHAGRTWTKLSPEEPGVDGWDLRGDGGYVVGPGSYYVPTDVERAKGKLEGAYSVEVDAPIAQAPDWLVALIMPKVHRAPVERRETLETSSYGRAALNAEVETLTGTQHGSLNNQINLSAFAIGQLVAGGEIRADEGFGALWEALCVLGVQDDGKAPGTLQRGWDAGMDVPRGAEHVEPVTPEQALGTRAPIAPPPPGSAPLPPVTAAPMMRPARGVTIWHDLMDAVFAGCCYVLKQDAIFVPRVGLLKKSAFDTHFGGYEFPTKASSAGTSTSAWDGFRLSPSWQPMIAEDIVFRPDREPGAVLSIDGRNYVNTWEPIVTKRIAGDPSRFTDFLAKILPVQRDRDILTSYMCALVQNPGRKFQWWPVVQGVKGNGKTLLLTVLAHAVGQRYAHIVNPEAMGKTGNQFNSWVQGNLLIGVEEIFVSDQRHVLESFKPLVTNVRTTIEGKGKDQTTGDNRANGLMLTNHRDGVPVADDERRYAIFWTAQQDIEDLARDGMGGGYFPDLYDWLHGRKAYAPLGEDYGLSVVNDWLRTAQPLAEFDPAGLCQRAPETSSTHAAIRESLGTFEQEILEAVESGQHGFRDGLITSLSVRALADRCRKAIAPKRYKAIMRSVGYVTHPALEGQRGRPNNPLADGSKPVLYFDARSQFMTLRTYQDVMDAAAIVLAGGAAPSNVVHLRPR
jgi:hypothetical protein